MDNNESIFESMLVQYKQGQPIHAFTLLVNKQYPVACDLIRYATYNKLSEAIAIDISQLMDFPEALVFRGYAAWRMSDSYAMQETLLALREINYFDEELVLLGRIMDMCKPARLREIQSIVAEVAKFNKELLLPVIDVVINNRVERFILDSGAEMTVLDKKYSIQMGISQICEGVDNLDTNKGKCSAGFGLVRRLKAIGATFSNVPVVIADISSLQSRFGNIKGILSPQELFSDRGMEIDYISGAVTLFVEEYNAPDIPMIFYNGRGCVGLEGSINNGPLGYFQIDTGGRCSTVTESYWNKLGLKAKHKADYEQGYSSLIKEDDDGKKYMQGIFRTSDSSWSAELKKLVVTTSAADSASNRSGRIGADVFTNRIVAFDYLRCKFYYMNGSVTN